MIDLRQVRDDPGGFDRALARRGHPPAAARLLELDTARRQLETRLQEDQATRNRLSREIGQGTARGEKPSPELLLEMSALKERVKQGEEQLRELQAELDALLPTFPNVLADDVPEGPDEDSNVELRRWGSPRNFAFDPPQMRIAVGRSVTWTNEDPVPHTATSTATPRAFDSGNLDQGQSFSFAFDTPGTYPYLCIYHPYMKGTVIVE